MSIVLYMACQLKILDFFIQYTITVSANKLHHVIIVSDTHNSLEAWIICKTIEA